LSPIPQWCFLTPPIYVINQSLIAWCSCFFSVFQIHYLFVGCILFVVCSIKNRVEIILHFCSVLVFYIAFTYRPALRIYESLKCIHCNYLSLLRSNASLLCFQNKPQHRPRIHTQVYLCFCLSIIELQRSQGQPVHYFFFS